MTKEQRAGSWCFPVLLEGLWGSLRGAAPSIKASRRRSSLINHHTQIWHFSSPRRTSVHPTIKQHFEMRLPKPAGCLSAEIGLIFTTIEKVFCNYTDHAVEGSGFSFGQIVWWYFRLVHQKWHLFFFLFNSLKLLIWSQHLIWADFSAHLWCNLMSVCVIHCIISAGLEEFKESALNKWIKENLLKKKLNKYAATPRLLYRQRQCGTMAL